MSRNRELALWAIVEMCRKSSLGHSVAAKPRTKVEKQTKRMPR